MLLVILERVYKISRCVFKYKIHLFSESRGSLLVLNKQATSKGNPSVPGGGSRKQTFAATLHYADLGDIQQNIFSLIIKITFCYGFS